MTLADLQEARRERGRRGRARDRARRTACKGTVIPEGVEVTRHPQLRRHRQRQGAEADPASSSSPPPSWCCWCCLRWAGARR
ncbi:MAG: hypothetical protein MZW92_79995 [Comamonadaceae bacterium]|nr:hypothetical protein [Comamonadaceae bacterium]